MAGSGPIRDRYLESQEMSTERECEVGISGYDDMEPERYNEKCGIFGVYNVLNASHTCYYGMVGLQHRGQEGGGMVGQAPEYFESTRHLTFDLFHHLRLSSGRAYGIISWQIIRWEM